MAAGKNRHSARVLAHHINAHPVSRSYPKNFRLVNRFPMRNLSQFTRDARTDLRSFTLVRGQFGAGNVPKIGWKSVLGNMCTIRLRNAGYAIRTCIDALHPRKIRQPCGGQPADAPPFNDVFGVDGRRGAIVTCATASPYERKWHGSWHRQTFCTVFEVYIMYWGLAGTKGWQGRDSY